ncbi:pucI, partial [Symbiodinium sp. KB8]
DAELDVVKLIIFLAYLMMHAALIQLGFQKLKRAVYWALPGLIIGMGGIAVWAATLSPISEALEAAEEKGPDHIEGSKAVAFMAAVNSSLGSWSTLLLNVCDLSRFSPTQKDQVWGQAVGVPVPFLATLFVGMWVAGATKVAFGSAVWQLPSIFGHWHPVLSVLGAVVLSIGTLVVNILANILSPINDIMNLAPKRFTYRGCGFFVLLLSFAVCPWWTFSGKVSFVLSFLSGYAMVTGAIAGIFLCDYWILRGRILDLEELYSSTGVKWRPLLAVAFGVAPCFPGFLDAILAHNEGHASLVGPFWAHLYSGGSCLVSLAISALVYYLLNFVGKDGRIGKPGSPSSPFSDTIRVTAMPPSLLFGFLGSGSAAAQLKELAKDRVAVKAAPVVSSFATDHAAKEEVHQAFASVIQRLCARLDAVDFRLTAALAAGSPWASLEVLKAHRVKLENLGRMNYALQSMTSTFQSLFSSSEEKEEKSQVKQEWKEHHFALHVYRKHIIESALSARDAAARSAAEAALQEQQESAQWSDDEAEAAAGETKPEQEDDVPEIICDIAEELTLRGLAGFVQYCDPLLTPPVLAAGMVRSLLLVDEATRAKKLFEVVFARSRKAQTMVVAGSIPVDFLSVVKMHRVASVVLRRLLARYESLGRTDLCHLLDHVLLEDFREEKHCQDLVLNNPLVQ